MGARLSHVVEDDGSDSDEYDCVGCCGGYDPSQPARRRFKGKQTKKKQKKKKKHVMELLAAEAKSNELLFRTVGRMCSNGSTSNACVFTQQGRKGINQDAMIVWENFDSSCPNTTFCGVFDGHGPFGHLVARKVRDALPSKISALKSADERSTVAMADSAAAATNEASLAHEEQHQKWFKAWRDRFTRAYHNMDKELKSHPTIDSFCSGTTAVTMLLQGRDMLIANVGDSRAILGTLSADDDSRVEAVQLTVDLKPNLPLEAERIKRCKGRVFALEDEPEVARVWLPHDDSPGLAMARAFGDFCLKDFGLIAVPEVTYARITERDQFIVLASDGIWDVLSNKEVVETIWEAPTRTTAARSLVETAVRAWRLKYPTSKVDDCAVVCYFFNKQQQRRHGLPEVTVSASSASASASASSSSSISSSASSAMAEVDFTSDHLPVTSASASMLEATVHPEVDPPQVDVHEDHFCASAGAVSVVSEWEIREGLTGSEEDEMKISANPATSASIAGLVAEGLIRLEPASSETATTDMEFTALHLMLEGENQNNICEHGAAGVMQRSDTLRSGSAGAMAIVAPPLSCTSVDETSDQYHSTQTNDESDGSMAAPEEVLPIQKEDAEDVRHSHVSVTEEAISSQVAATSSIPSDGASDITRSLAEKNGDSLTSSLAAECSSAPESDGGTATTSSLNHAQDDIQIHSDQENVTNKLDLHIHAESESLQQPTPSADQQQPTSGCCVLDVVAATRSMAELEGAPSEITAMSEEETDADRISPLLARSASRRSLAECLSVADDEEWSALEGVARVNSLLNLPRFLQRGRSEMMRRVTSSSSSSSSSSTTSSSSRSQQQSAKKKMRTPWKLLSWSVLSFKRIAQRVRSAQKKSKKRRKKRRFALEEGAEEQIRIWY